MSGNVQSIPTILLTGGNGGGYALIRGCGQIRGRGCAFISGCGQIHGCALIRGCGQIDGGCGLLCSYLDTENQDTTAYVIACFNGIIARISEREGRQAKHGIERPLSGW